MQSFPPIEGTGDLIFGDGLQDGIASADVGEEEFIECINGIFLWPMTR
jgi:hypothetical protein